MGFAKGISGATLTRRASVQGRGSLTLLAHAIAATLATCIALSSAEAQPVRS